MSEQEVHSRLRHAMTASGIDALVAHSMDNVTYTSGFLVPSQASNRFRRAIAVLAGDDFGCQIVVSVEAPLARERSRFSDVRAYDQFADDPADSLANALIEAGEAV
jgi:Xaa-Pro aminopeptidase